MHQDVLEVASIRQHQLSMELQAAFAEAAEDANDLFPPEEVNVRHGIDS